MKKYKIVAIAQIYNELEKNNLKRFIKYLKPLVDDIVIFDDGSTDGSFEYCLENTTYVIRGGKNDFASEISHKQLLLNKTKELKADFVLWLDADEVLSIDTREILQDLCLEMIDKDIDGLSMHEINIWRSATWQRIDSLYDTGWFVRLWRITPSTKFASLKKGLHQQQYPSTLKKITKTSKISVLHFGFSSEKNLAFKYITYKAHGQRGYNTLDRLINEEKLQVKKVPESLFPKGLYKENDQKPQKLSFFEAIRYVEAYRPKVTRPKYSIVCLIYKSTEWLEFVYEQLLKYTDMTDVEFYFVANDATPEVLAYLKNNYIPHYVWSNSPKQREEWYINNVYRAWNFAAEKAKGDFVIFINSDMAFSPTWLENLVKAYNGKNCVTSRLVESGKMPSGLYGISKNFGRSIERYQESKFITYAKKISEECTKNSGLYMPLFIRRNHFLSVGGYPEGNIVPNSNIFKPRIARQNETCISGDSIFIQKLAIRGITHQTAFNSVVYHFQEGEMDSKKTKGKTNDKHIAICNDYVTGMMGEKVLWDYLLEKLPATYGVDTRMVRESSFEKNAKAYIRHTYPQTDVIVQNVSFINSIDRSIYTVGFLQDNLREMGKVSKQQEYNLKAANTLITNSLHTAMSYSEYDFEIIPIGINEKLFRPMNKISLREKYEIREKKVGIFVGSFSEVKGWSKVKACIRHFPDIFWIVVTKNEETFHDKNVRVFKKVLQKKLAELYNCADFFILGSPVETECLAAIEAASCNIPIIMRNTGVFAGFTQEEKDNVGIFGEDFVAAVNAITKRKFTPRKIIIEKGLLIENTIEKWRKVFENAKQVVTTQNVKNSYEQKATLKLAVSRILEIYSYGVLKSKVTKKIVNKMRRTKNKIFR